MSAVVATDLPRSWRPLGTRLASYVFGAMLLVLLVTVWVAWGPDIRGRFTFFQKATVVFIGLLGFGCLYGLARCRVTARREGLVVVNGFRSRRYEWAELVSASLRRGAPFATLDLSDGTTVSMFGIQSSDGSRAVAAVQELREVMDAESQTDRND